MITRFSSRRQNISASFLNEKLTKAVSYDRIAGYFSSSLLEVAGEAIDTIAGISRIICNSQIDIRDMATARSAEMAIRQEWCNQVDSLVSPES
ncbi:MAG: hypothetical protein GX876_05320, partial [Bacteroidales bacterium]|nr:hypothetical protein [Bacteroidales bacterium]